MEVSVSKRNDKKTLSSLRIDQQNFTKRGPEVQCVGRLVEGWRRPREHEARARQR
jgi:hypothetical protein